MPIFLGLGSWDTYVSAASVFYQHIHLNLSLFQHSSMTFLTSPATLRPRSLVSKIQLHFTVKDHLLLFDTGYTVSKSMGKMIKMNIPTVLRSMKMHGRLREVELLILKGLQVDLGGGRESAAGVPGYYFPMAKIQMGCWHSMAESDELLEPAEVIVAPAFLACRAFQSGLLPLLEEGVFEETSLALQSVDDTEGHTDGDNSSTTAHRVHRDAFVRYWLGATVLELLDIPHIDEAWTDPFPITAQCGRDPDPDDSMADLPVSASVPGTPHELVPSHETQYDQGLVSSPIRYPSTSTSGSDTDSSSDVVVTKVNSLHDELRQEEEDPYQRETELPDDDRSSEDSSSREEFVRELHRTFGTAASKEHDSTDRVGARNSFADINDETPLSPEDSSDGSPPSPAAIHLEVARAELITTLTAAAAMDDDTRQAIAIATADRKLNTSHDIPRGAGFDAPRGQYDTFVVQSSESSSEDYGDTSLVGSIVLDEVTLGPLVASGSTRLPSDEEADTDTTSSPSSTSSSGDERGHEVSPEDLSQIEDVFGARAVNETQLDVNGGSTPTNCILASGKGKERAASVDLGYDGQAETQADTGDAKSNSPKSPAQSTTPAPQSAAPDPLTPLSARSSKGPVKSKGTQTKRLPDKPAQTGQTPAGKAAAAADNDRVSRKRKAPPPSITPTRPARESRSKRRKRARAAKEEQLQVARRIEAEAAEREETLVN